MRVVVVWFYVNWGLCILVIFIVFIVGFLDVGIYCGNVNSDVFLGFVYDYLVFNVFFFNGINLCLIVVMGMFIVFD